MNEKDLAAVVGTNIAIRRRKLGFTQADLAEMLDVGQDALSRMEKGVISPKMGRLRDLAGALQCSVADLFREADEDATDRAAAIAEQLAQLTPEQQNAVVRIVEEAVRGMRGK